MSKSIQFKKQNENVYPHPYYPVGSIYLSVVNTNPSRWFGGTWEQIAKGRTLVGVDTSDTDFNTVKKTGGGKQIMIPMQWYSGFIDMRYKTGLNIPSWENYRKEVVANTVSLSNEGAANAVMGTNEVSKKDTNGNLPPYFTCYIWCRTA